MHAPADEIATAAVQLARAGRWDAAEHLLAATESEGIQDSAALALAQVEVAIESDLFRGTARTADALANAEPVVRAAADPVKIWDLELGRIRQRYAAALQHRATADAELTAKAHAAFDTAPDRSRAGWAAFYHGVIADNLEQDGNRARELYELALSAAGASGDELLASYALRHLGGHAEDRGDLVTARELAERSAELRARTGFVPGVLAQQVILASLAAAEGDESAARAIASEVRRWADALGLHGVAGQARSLL